MFKKRIDRQNPGKYYSPSVQILGRNRLGVVELVRRESLMFARVENGVTKSCQNDNHNGVTKSCQKFRRENRKTRNFGL